MNITKGQRFRSLPNVSGLASMLGHTAGYLYEYVKAPQYAYFEIPKGKGGKRSITAPHPDLKEIQSSLNGILQEVYRADCPPCSHGFVGGSRSRHPRTIITNARAHVNKAFVLNMDLKDFFDSISAIRVRRIFLDPPFGFKRELATCIALLCTYEKKLPTGAPTSPVLSNMVCRELDIRLQKLALKHNLAYTRYADDLSFSSDEELTKEAVQGITSIIQAEEFEVNRRKTRTRSRNNRQTVTGIVVNEKPNVPRQYIRLIRAILHNVEVKGISAAAERYFSTRVLKGEDRNTAFQGAVAGKIHHVGNVRGRRDLLYQKLLARYYNHF